MLGLHHKDFLQSDSYMTNLRGFYKDPNPKAKVVKPKLVKVKEAKPPKPRKRKFYKASKDNDRFYLSENWRKLRYLVLTNCDGRCMCWGASAKDGVRIHVDHIKPRSKYPKFELDITNLQCLCDDCNIGKSNWDETDWRQLVD